MYKHYVCKPKWYICIVDIKSWYLLVIQRKSPSDADIIVVSTELVGLVFCVFCGCCCCCGPTKECKHRCSSFVCTFAKWSSFIHFSFQATEIAMDFRECKSLLSCCMFVGHLNYSKESFYAVFLAVSFYGFSYFAAKTWFFNKITACMQRKDPRNSGIAWNGRKDKNASIKRKFEKCTTLQMELNPIRVTMCVIACIDLLQTQRFIPIWLIPFKTKCNKWHVIRLKRSTILLAKCAIASDIRQLTANTMANSKLK